MYDVWFPNLGIKIKKLPEVFFSLFGFDVYVYGVLVALGIAMGLFIVLREARLTKQDVSVYMDFSLYALVFGLIGARVYYVMFLWSSYRNDFLKIFAIRDGGLAIYGGIIAIAVVAIFFCGLKKYDVKLFFDTCVFGLLTGQVIGRWGNFFNREAFGGNTNSLFAMRYPVSSVTFVSDQVKPIVVDGIKYIQVHPTFLYESLWNFVLLICLLLYRRHKKFDGELALYYVLFYGLGRFFIESLRTDQLLLFDIYPISQVIAFCSIVVSIAFLIVNYVSLPKDDKVNKKDIDLDKNKKWTYFIDI